MSAGTHIHGTHVPVEEPSTASKPDTGIYTGIYKERSANAMLQNSCRKAAPHVTLIDFVIAALGKFAAT
jgi:hypothetical protein